MLVALPDETASRRRCIPRRRTKAYLAFYCADGCLVCPRAHGSRARRLSCRNASCPRGRGHWHRLCVLGHPETGREEALMPRSDRIPHPARSSWSRRARTSTTAGRRVRGAGPSSGRSVALTGARAIERPRRPTRPGPAAPDRRGTRGARPVLRTLRTDLPMHAVRAPRIPRRSRATSTPAGPPVHGSPSQTFIALPPSVGVIVSVFNVTVRMCPVDVNDRQPSTHMPLISQALSLGRL
jgi:hypothetical protein